MRKWLFALLSITLLFTATTTPILAYSQVSDEAESHIIAELNQANIPNAAIAIIHNGEVSYILHNSEHDALFAIGSVTKSFTGFGVLLLEDMGLLSVSDPVNQHLPWLEVNYNGLPVLQEDITIYTLLQHTSGFTADENRFPSTVNELGKDELIAQLAGIELAFYPSLGHMYGNVNYIILGLIIEAVSGQSYDDFMTHNVLHPLGLYNTFANVNRAYDTCRVIGGHRLGFFRPRPTNEQWGSQTMPSGGMYSNISDMSRWAGIHLGVIEVNEQFTRVVQRSHENNHTSPNPFADTDFHAAAGWNVMLEGNYFVGDGKIMHGGSTFGYVAYVGIIPERDMAIVMLSNVRQMNLSQWVFLLWDAVDGEFNTVGTDFFAIMDIAFVVLTALGALFIGLFVRLIIKLHKQVQSGERVKSKFKIRWLVAFILSIIGVLIFHVVMPMLFIMPLGTLLLFSPASAITAIVSMWIMMGYSLLSLCVKPQ